MKVKNEKFNYTEWFSADEINEHSKDWLSQLLFIKDEHQFLLNLIQTFSTKKISKNQLNQLEDFKNAINENEIMLHSLISQVKKHMNQLKILVDGVNQLEMEHGYKKTHKELFMSMNQYMLDYRTVKERGFAKLTSIMKITKPSNNNE
ncbi:hypothetical protein Q2T41_14500 [Maribacter confluentis]|uniref:Uncharacterized protein n=1 Tax=Maribacter confluentis TaxID=1656093 RepID=A0ABT8RTD5_9FLAO|nr:hypothetical protein [Maribacter confluentis]MDO1513868.1 hypothetical protein [Maribacter confluentis]